jgi:O-acetylhomoserine/O-acetylserine sulfhydrylase-like pyridoxal-dependent enzyme
MQPFRLEDHPRVRRVYYPGFAGPPGHEIAAGQMDRLSGTVSFEVKGGLSEARDISGTRVGAISRIIQSSMFKGLLLFT